MAKVIVTVEHTLGQAEARGRIKKMLHRVPDLGGVWKERWTSGTCLHFTGMIRGQTITGEVHVEDRVAKVLVMLPWTLALFACRIKSVLEQSCRQALS